MGDSTTRAGHYDQGGTSWRVGDLLSLLKANDLSKRLMALLALYFGHQSQAECKMSGRSSSSHADKRHE